MIRDRHRLREQMVTNGCRSETIGRNDREAKEYLTQGNRSYDERKRFRGHYYGNFATVEEREAFDLAYRNCPSRDSVTNFGRWSKSRWRELAAWKS